MSAGSPPVTSTSHRQPWFALIDMNSYFATLEQQANPTLRGKPIGIVKEVGRTCIIAASKEAKALGVQTGERLVTARQKVPQLIAVPAHFHQYFHATKQLYSIFTNLSPDVDLYSLDEAFIDLTSCRNIFSSAEVFFAHARQCIHRELGEWVTCSVGFGANRLQAKLGSEFAAKDGYFELTRENLSATLSQTPVEMICGIGRGLTPRLHRAGITHVHQLNFCDDAFLREHFGPFWSIELRRIGRGEETHLLDLRKRVLPHMKSVSRSKTLFVATSNISYLHQALYNLTEEMCFKARRMKLAGSDISMSLRDTDGRHWSGKSHLQGRAANLTTDVYSIISHIFHDILQKWKSANFSRSPKIIKIGVGLGGLIPENQLSTTWLPEVKKMSAATKAVDAVNERFGLFTVKPARLLGFRIIKPEVTGYLGDRDYQLKFQ